MAHQVAHPEHRSRAGRRKTYENWPSTGNPQDPDVLAQAGFFFTGDKDHVVCYHCGHRLGDWLEDHDPWLQHLISSPSCPHILLTRGHSYVEANLTSHSPDNISVKQEEEASGPSLHNFEVVCPLGSTDVKNCEKIRRKVDGKMLVWKKICYREGSSEEKQLLMVSVKRLLQLDDMSPMVNYIDYVDDPASSTLYVITEFLQVKEHVGSVVKRLHGNEYIKEGFIWLVLINIAEALNACHTALVGGKPILHRDINPSNIFILNHKIVALSGFGLKLLFKHQRDKMRTQSRTMSYMPPELLRDENNYSAKCDMWGLGCTLYEMCCREAPFYGMGPKSQDLKRIPDRYSDLLNQMIAKLLTKDPSKRPSASDMIKIIEIHQHEIISKIQQEEHTELLQEIAAGGAAPLVEMLAQAASQDGFFQHVQGQIMQEMAMDAAMKSRFGENEDEWGDIKVGDVVRVRRSVVRPVGGWAGVSHDSVGTVTSVTDLQVVVKFPECAEWRGLKREVQHDSSSSRDELSLRPGSHVRVRLGVVEPVFGWNGATPSSVGVVRQMIPHPIHGVIVEVNFPESPNWLCLPKEIQTIPASASTSQCRPPSVGDRVKLKPGVNSDQIAQAAIGTILSIRDNFLAEVEFPDIRWIGALSKLEVLGDNYQKDCSSKLKVGMEVGFVPNKSTPRGGWGKLRPSSKGTLKSLVGDLALVDFSGTEWRGPLTDLQPALLVHNDGQQRLRIGQRVRIRPSVSTPLGGWGEINPSKCGTLTEIIDGREAVVNVGDVDWNLPLGDLQSAEEDKESSASGGIQPFKVGDKVRRKTKKGKKKKGSRPVGTVKSFTSDCEVVVDFPEQIWKGKPEDLQLVDGP